MSNFINKAIAFVSPFAAVPTGWAIYAGVTKQPAFPIWWPAAIVGAVSIIFVDIAAASLVTDMIHFNQSLKNKTERLLTMNVHQAWYILILAVAAEIVLSLVVVVFEQVLEWAVAVFPMMTLAGVFAYAVRTDLQKRIAERDELRAKSKRKPRTTSASPKPSAKSPKGWPRKCEYCDEQLQVPQSKGAHMKKHHPEKTIQKAYLMPEMAKKEGS